jgi:cephalosporin hydroxylase/SAM-dependent methyltransferase
MEHMALLVEKYLNDKDKTIICDIGSFDVNGSYRELFDKPGWTYTGIDMSPGKNVDMVLASPYEYPLPSGYSDCIVSGQAFEHIEYFWIAWMEMVRILKPGGFIFLIAPSRGPEHRYPVDCWRFYPDSYCALAHLAGLNLTESSTDWVPHSDPGSSEWGDTVGVFQKPRFHQLLEKGVDDANVQLFNNQNDSIRQLVNLLDQTFAEISSILESRRWKTGNLLGNIFSLHKLKKKGERHPAEKIGYLSKKAGLIRNEMVVNPETDRTISPVGSFIRSYADFWRLQNERNFCEDYFKWYYNSGIWERLTFMGVPCLKSVSDMWNYQEIITELQPSLVVEFGTRFGGSALYFSQILKGLPHVAKVITVDIDSKSIHERAKAERNIEFMTISSISPKVKDRLLELKTDFPGPIFAILDSDHKKSHVLSEMELLRDILVTGDYLVVEDGVVNGHPILPDFGPGPYEAVEEYFNKYPRDYLPDTIRENKFGFTLAPKGFLKRL